MENNGKKIGNVIRYKLCEKINNTNPQTMHVQHKIIRTVNDKINHWNKRFIYTVRT